MEFFKFDAISIDHGITEKADQIYVLPGAFGWDDVGSWLAVGRIRKSNDNGNVVEGDIITINSTDNVIQGENKLRQISKIPVSILHFPLVFQYVFELYLTLQPNLEGILLYYLKS